MGTIQKIKVFLLLVTTLLTVSSPFAWSDESFLRSKKQPYESSCSCSYVSHKKNVCAFTGPTGHSGPQGVQGSQGITGPAGTSGPMGVAGSIDPCCPGPKGPSGIQAFGSFFLNDFYLPGVTDIIAPGHIVPIAQTRMKTSNIATTVPGTFTINQTGSYLLEYEAQAKVIDRFNHDEKFFQIAIVNVETSIVFPNTSITSNMAQNNISEPLNGVSVCSGAVILPLQAETTIAVVNNSGRDPPPIPSVDMQLTFYLNQNIPDRDIAAYLNITRLGDIPP